MTASYNLYEKCACVSDSSLHVLICHSRPGCSYQAGGQSSAPAHDSPGPLVSEPPHRVHCGRPDCIKADRRGLRHLWVEWDHWVLHCRWVICSWLCHDYMVHYCTSPSVLVNKSGALREQNIMKWMMEHDARQNIKGKFIQSGREDLCRRGYGGKEGLNKGWKLCCLSLDAEVNGFNIAGCRLRVGEGRREMWGLNGDCRVEFIRTGSYELEDIVEKRLKEKVYHKKARWSIQHEKNHLTAGWTFNPKTHMWLCRANLQPG